MGLRTFVASDGSSWTVWNVQTNIVSSIPGSPSEWLAFQNDESTERRRLLDIPEGWEELSEERLDLLRRIAVPAKVWGHLSPPGGVERIDDVSGADSK